MSFMQVRKDIESGRLKPLYILTGEEKAVMGKYLSMLNKPNTAPNFASVVPKLKTQGLFGGKEKQVYIIKEDKDVTDIQLKQLLDLVGKKATIFLIFDKIDKRKKFFKDASKYIYEFDKLDNAYVYVQQSLGVTERQARLISDRCNGDIGKIDLEMDKIQQLGDIQLTDELLNELITPSPEDKIWEFIDCILSKDPKGAYQRYDDLKVLNQNEIYFIGLMYNNFKTVLMLLGMANRTPQQIAKETGLNQWQLTNCKKIVDRHLRGMEVSEVIYYLQELQNLEVGIKTGKIDGELGFKVLINEFMGA